MKPCSEEKARQLGKRSEWNGVMYEQSGILTMEKSSFELREYITEDRSHAAKTQGAPPFEKQEREIGCVPSTTFLRPFRVGNPDSNCTRKVIRVPSPRPTRR